MVSTRKRARFVESEKEESDNDILEIQVIPTKKRNSITPSKTTTSSSNPSQVQTTSSSNSIPSRTAPISSRRKVQQEVAEARASHFARADKTDISTTPTGTLRNSLLPQSRETAEESWPGPFSTAKSILENRELALKKREEKLKAIKEGIPDSVYRDDEDADIYEKTLSKLSWNPQPSTSKYIYNVPTLNELCLQSIAKSIHLYENISVLSPEQQDRLMEILMKRKVLTFENILKFISPYSTSIKFLDCSELTDDMLLQIIEINCGLETSKDFDESIQEVDKNQKSKANKDQEKDLDLQHHGKLHSLVLNYCGRCFTDKVSSGIIRFLTDNIEVLSLSGCYKLSNEALSRLVYDCCETLLAVNISYNNILNSQGIKSFSSLKSLTSLSLNYNTQLIDSDLLSLLPLNQEDLPLPFLKEVSFIGLTEVKETFFIQFLKSYGRQLTLLDLSNNTLLVTDETIIAIRSYCTAIETLNLNSLYRVSLMAWTGLFIVQNFDSLSSTENNINNQTNSYQIQSLGKIQHVSLKGNIAILDECMLELCKNYGKYLISLNINGCNSITDKTLVALSLHSNFTLSTIDISFVRSVTENGLGYLLEQCPQLNHLSIWGCTQISKKLYYDPRYLSKTIIGKIEI